ncbi:uncharacterized protein LOC143366376 isoform X2 [Andrena cerasifolii]|uniref:uncharacterized protein LOC143366376 isoform X2 n=1 Tax=Andrena cerasifolii TaxID=2819439 RepID=UPI0040381378
MKCLVPSCTNRSDCQNWKKSTYRTDVKHTFHRLPRNSDTCSVWLDLLGIKSASVSKSSRICSAHFEEKCFDRSGLNVQLRPNALPRACQTVITEKSLCTDVKPLNLPEDDTNTNLSPNRMQSLIPEKKEEATTSLDGISKLDECPLTSQPAASKQDKETMTVPFSETSHFLEKTWLRQRIKFLETDSKKKVRLMQQQIRRKNDQLITLKSMLEDLKNKQAIKTNQAKPMNTLGGLTGELYERLIQQKSNVVSKCYSPNLRCFALTLQYYSPRAYEYVREEFGNCLPHPKTLSSWYRTVDGEPDTSLEGLESATERIQNGD